MSEKSPGPFVNLLEISEIGELSGKAPLQSFEETIIVLTLFSIACSLLAAFSSSVQSRDECSCRTICETFMTGERLSVLLA